METKKQYAALPYIVLKKHIEVLLITRRRSRRWIIPKGWPEKDMSAPEVAALEAFEEAGLKGQINGKSIGGFSYIKQLGDGSKVKCDVDVYPLEVSAQYLHWPEKSEREYVWLKRKKAGLLIEETELSKLIRNFRPPNKRIKNRNRPKVKKKSKIRDKISSCL